MNPQEQEHLTDGSCPGVPAAAVVDVAVRTAASVVVDVAAVAAATRPVATAVSLAGPQHEAEDPTAGGHLWEASQVAATLL